MTVRHDSIWLRRLLVSALVLAAVPLANAADRVVIVSEGGTAKDWQPAPGLAVAVPAYPSTVADKSEDACVSIGYLVKPDGSTADLSLLKAWTTRDPKGRSAERVDPFARNALAAVQQWRFVPVAAGGKVKSVYTSATFAFSSNPQADHDTLRKECAIKNLSAFVAKAQADAYKRGNLKKSEMDRNREERPSLGNYNKN